MNHSALVRVIPGFRAAVNLRTDLHDLAKVSAYIPTKFATRLLDEITAGLQDASTARAFLVHGAYGTGKSHLALTICAFLGHDWGEKASMPVIGKMQRIDAEMVGRMSQERIRLRSPLLVVPISGSEAATREILLSALDEALQQAGLSDVMPETAFHAAVMRIDTIKTAYPDSVSDMANAFRLHGYPSVQAIENDLRQFNRAALQAFEAAHPLFSRGARADLHQNQRPEDIYAAVSRTLSQLPHPKQRSGILVVWDEFGIHLENILEDPKQKAYLDLQNFMEACSSSGSMRLFFIGLAHRSVEQTVALIPGLPNNQKETLNRMAGRFLQRRIMTEPGEQFTLLSRILLPVDQAQSDDFWRRNAQWSAQFASLTQSLGLFKGLGFREIDRLIRQTFPLHPVVTFLLPTISERIAQNDRTLFHFMSDTGPDGLPAFLGSEPVEENGRLNLMTTDRLFPFFSTMIASSRLEEVRTLWSRFRKLPPQKDSSVQRILHTLLLLLIAKQAELPPNTEGLALALGHTSPGQQSTLEETLERMRRNKLIRRWPNGEFDFRGLDGEIDLAEVLETALNNVQAGVDLTQVLQTWAKESDIGVDVIARTHNLKFALNRQYAGEPVTIAGLRGSRYTDTGAPREKDGIAYWLIPLSEEELWVGQGLALKFQNPRALIIVPEMAPQLHQLARKFLALTTVLREYPQVFGPAGFQRDEWVTESNHIHTEIRGRLQRAFRSVTVYLQGNPNRCDSRDQIEELASRGMDVIYPKSLRINHDRLIDTSTIDGQKSNRISVMKALLESPLEHLTHSTVKQISLIVETVLKQPGFLRKDLNGEWIIDRPDDRVYPNSAAVWDHIESYITSRTKKYGSFLLLIDDLTSPPYGLRPRTLPILLAAVMRGHLASLTFVNQGKPVDLTADLIERLVKDPQQVSILYAALTYEQRWVLEQFVDRLGSIVGLAENAPLKHVFRATSRFLDRLPRLAVTSTQVSPTTRAIRDQVLIPISHIHNVEEDERKLRKYLFEDLPAMCGLEELKNANISAIKGTIGHELAKAAAELQDLFPSRVLPLLADIFSATSADEATIKQAIGDFRTQVSRTARHLLTPSHRAFVESLQKLIDDPVGQVDELAKALGHRSSNEWSDNDLISLEAAAKLVRSDLKRLAKVAHVPAPTPVRQVADTTVAAPPSIVHKKDVNQTSQLHMAISSLSPPDSPTAKDVISATQMAPKEPSNSAHTPVGTMLLQFDGEILSKSVGQVLPPIVQGAVNSVLTMLNMPGLSPHDRLQVAVEVLAELLRAGSLP